MNAGSVSTVREPIRWTGAGAVVPSDRGATSPTCRASHNWTPWAGSLRAADRRACCASASPMNLIFELRHSQHLLIFLILLLATLIKINLLLFANFFNSPVMLSIDSLSLKARNLRYHLISFYPSRTISIKSYAIFSQHR